MFDNIVLDVFIGLVLIYLLYSLFITIVSEMIVTWMALRSRVLRVAIEKMLNDGMHNRNYPARNFLQRWWNIVQRYFLKEFDDFKSSLAGKFYSSPSIKYLSDNGGEHKTSFSQTKPSYISAEMFAESLIRLLKDKGNGATDIEKVLFCLKFNTHHIEPATLKNLRDLTASCDNDINAIKAKFKAWYNETMDRATGWYKRRMQLILFWLGLIVAIAFNVDSIQIAKMLSKDTDARNELVSMGIQLSKDSARYSNFILQSDTLNTRDILDSGYAHVTKDIADANVILGLGWPLANLMKNEKSCFDEKKDSASFAVLKEYKNIFNDFTGAYNNLQNSSRVNKKKSDSLRQKLLIYKKDTTVFTLEQVFAPDSVKGKLNDTLTKTNSLIDSTINRLSIAEAKTKADSAVLMLLIETRKKATGQVNTYTSGKFVLIDSIVNDTAGKKIIVYTQQPYSTPEKIWHVLKKCNPFSSDFWSFIFSIHFLGLFITALMLSLGAPFWFDLLKKLVAIRGAGVKPEEKKPDIINETVLPVAEENNGLQTRPEEVTEVAADACEEALKKYGPEIKKIPGVKSVFSVIKNKIKQIQVNVDNEATKEAVRNQFPNLIVSGVEVPQNIVVSGVPLSHAGDKGIISNRSGKNGFGSLGCVLKRKETGSKHLLSCWHVLKGDIDYSDSDSEPVIIDKESGAELAFRWAGGIMDKFDYGLAICKADIVYSDNSFLKTKLGLPKTHKIEHQPLSLKDIDNQIPVRYYDSLNDKIVSGLIYTNTPAVDINYIDKTRTVKDILILTNENEQTISHEGNSGSIVFDDKNNAIAMIIAGDKNYTYAIMISNIFSIHTEMDIA